ncbi:MAG: phosphatase PAP2 family protein [Pseudomonadota bacterium]|nr:phosphatase PAP2 family protein [Pseudomonadota bacterium]
MHSFLDRWFASALRPLRAWGWLALLSLFAGNAVAGGIDHRLNKDESGIYNRNVQVGVQDGTIALTLALALWEGSDSRFGKTAWQGVDSIALGAVTAQAMKYAFSRSRPSQTNDPNRWFQGSGNQSFPSGEVMLVTTAVTPYILEYGRDHPEVYALALLPLYDAVARVKSQAHWQTDVLASLAIGTAIGYYAHGRDTPISVGILPRGITIGFHKRF